MQKLLALLVSDNDIPSDSSWGFIAQNYPGALVELVRANGGFLRDGEWFTGLYLVGGVLALLLLALRGHYRTSMVTMLMTAGAVVSLVYVLGAPVFSAFRLELAFVPMAAYGIALGTNLLLARLLGAVETPKRLAAKSPAA